MTIKAFLFPIIVCLALIYFNSCTPDVNTTDGQNSMSIAESTESGLFLQEYRTVYSPEGFLEIEEAWIEPIWWNAVDEGNLLKDIDIHSQQLCFRSNEEKSTHKLKRVGETDTVIVEASTNQYVGTHGVWNVSLNHRNLPDTITLNIYFKPSDVPTKDRRYLDKIVLVKK
jgi:hypothetical protein